MYKLNTIGSDTIKPIILRELRHLMTTGRVDLAEAYTLLDITPALYLSRAEGNNTSTYYNTSAYYAEIEPKILTLLAKYNVSWVLDRTSLREYVIKFLTGLGFKQVADDLFYITSELISPSTYDVILLKAVISHTSKHITTLDIVEE